MRNTRRIQAISIHALAGRATKICRVSLTVFAFQSTPSRGGRRHIPADCNADPNFNPRPRGEGDGGATVMRLMMPEIISIHALAGRATPVASHRIHADNHFNPRPRGEGDSKGLDKQAGQDDFNPRPRGEGDQIKSGKAFADRVISIHALAGRATASSHKNYLPKCIFIRQYVNKHAYNWQIWENSRLFSPFLPLFFGANLPVFLCTHRVRI